MQLKARLEHTQDSSKKSAGAGGFTETGASAPEEKGTQDVGVLSQDSVRLCLVHEGAPWHQHIKFDSLFNLDSSLIEVTRNLM